MALAVLLPFVLMRLNIITYPSIVHTHNLNCRIVTDTTDLNIDTTLNSTVFNNFMTPKRILGMLK